MAKRNGTGLLDAMAIIAETVKSSSCSYTVVSTKIQGPALELFGGALPLGELAGASFGMYDEIESSEKDGQPWAT